MLNGNTHGPQDRVVCPRGRAALQSQRYESQAAGKGQSPGHKKPSIFGRFYHRLVHGQQVASARVM